MIKLQSAERALVSNYIYSVTGIALDESKDYLIEGRLSAIAEHAGCAGYANLVSRAQSDPSRALERRIIDAITTNETMFFRDNSPFELLRHKIIPELIDRNQRSGRNRIRIWSAACSTGQELYSTAMLLKELLGDPQRYGVSLLGTDISDEAVAKASKGQFSPVEISRGLTPELRVRYFSQHGTVWQIRDEVRAMASFRRYNLLHDLSALGRFDIVMCRNVAIYFNETDRRNLFSRIARLIDPGGCLLVGSMESLSGMPQFEARHHLRSVYYQVKP